MKLGRAVSAAVLMMASFLILSGCQKHEGSAEKAGKAIDQATEQAGQKIDSATEKLGEEIEKAGKKIQDASKRDDK